MRRGLAKSQSVLNIRRPARRIGLCWEATRAPGGTRIPQAWAAGTASGQGTFAQYSSGGKVVGWYVDGDGHYHGFIATPTSGPH